MSKRHIFDILSEQHSFLNVDDKALGTISSSGVVTAVYSDDNNSLIFYYCQEAPKPGKMFCGLTATYVYEDFDVINGTSQADIPWDEVRDNIITISFDTSFSTVRPVSTAFWFCNMNNCERIDLENLNTSETIQMQQMFANCPLIVSLNLGEMDISNVERISNMIANCSALKELNVDGWNTGNVLYMDSFAEGCNALKIINATQDFIISDDLQNDTNMFYDCVSLVGGNGTEYDPSKVDSSMAHIDDEDNPGYFTAL